MGQPGTDPTVMRVEVDVYPVADRFSERLRSQVEPQAQQLGQDLGRRIAAPISANLGDGITGGLRNARTSVGQEARAAGDTYTSAFAKQLTAGLDKALAKLPAPKVPIDADSSKIDKTVDRLRNDILALKDARFELGDDEAIAKIQDLRNRLSALSRDIEKTRANAKEPIEIDADALAAMAAITSLKRELADLQKEEHTVTVTPKVDEGAFAARLRAAVTKAAASLPDIAIRADATDAEQEIGSIRADLTSLGNQRIGIDISAADALAEVNLLKERLAALRGTSVDIDVDTAAATAHLDALAVKLDIETRDRNVNVDVDTANAETAVAGLANGFEGASSNMSLLIGAAPLIAAAIVPAAAAATGAVAALGLGIAAAGAGIGVLALGAVPIIGALQAMDKAQQSHTQNTARAATVADHTASAERALAQARVQNARAIDDAERAQARAQAQAQQQVAAARKQVADAARQAAAAIAAADANVATQEKSLTAALKDQEKAQLAVVAARKQAQQDAEDLASRVANNLIAQRQAVLDLEAAQTALDHAKANPATTADQMEQAQIVYDRQHQQLEDLKTEGERLADQKADSDKKGIENSDLVVAAKAAEAAATQKVADQEAALAKARTARDQAVIDGQAKIAAAEQNLAQVRLRAQQQVADAHRTLTRAQEDAQTRIAAATAQLTSAQQGYTTAINGSTIAADALHQKLALLSPDARNLVTYLFGLKGVIAGLARDAQGFAAPLEQGLKAVFSPQNLALIGQFVRDVSVGVGGALKLVLTDFASPFWQQFFGWLAGVAKEVLPLFGQGFIYVAHTIASLLQAFEPVAKQVGGGLLTLLAGIAKWAAGLHSDPKFQAFLAYIIASGPQIMQFVFAFLRAAVALGVALAPLGSVVLGLFTRVLNFIANMDPKTLRLIADAIVAIFTGMLLAKGIAAIVNGVAKAVELLGVAFEFLSGPVGIVIAVIALLAVGLIYLFNHNKAFHDFVIVAWARIRAAISTAWTQYIRPALAALWTFITTQLVPALVWLWKNVIVPAWNAIAAIITWAWNVIIWPALQAMNDFINNVLAPVLTFLWQDIIVPAFTAITDIISWAWENIISPVFSAIHYFIVTFLAPVFRFLRGVVQDVWDAITVAIQIAWGILSIIFAAFDIVFRGIVAPAFNWLYNTVINPIWTAVSKIISDVWNNNIKPIFTALGDFIHTYVAPVFQAGVDLLSKAWNGLRDAAKGPVDFLVRTVINNGIVGGLQWLADHLDVKIKVPTVPWPPKGWATGGPVWGEGTATSDSIIARLSNGEHVWTAAEVDAAGGHNRVMGLRQAALAGQFAVPGYATGGAVEKPWWQTAVDFLGNKAKGAISDVKQFGADAAAVIADPGKALSALVDRLIGAMPDKDTPFGKIITGMPRTVLSYIQQELGLVQGAGGGQGGASWNGTIAAGAVGAMQKWALDQRGKTYLWSAVGPDHYDCSGLVGDLWAMATGHPLYQRYFTTNNETDPRFGLQDGPGTFTVYLGPGHTAANIGGMHVEAFHGNGTPLAIGHVGTPLSYYNRVMHLPGLAEGGPVTDELAHGLTLGPAEQLMSWLATGWPEPPAAVLPALSFDGGGWLPDTRSLPGQVMPIHHGQSKPDAVLTHQQFNDMHTLAQTGARRGAAGSLVHIEQYHERGADPHAVAKELDWISRGLG